MALGILPHHLPYRIVILTLASPTVYVAPIETDGQIAPIGFVKPVNQVEATADVDTVDEIDGVEPIGQMLNVAHENRDP